MPDEIAWETVENLLEETCSKFHKLRIKQFASMGITSHQAAILLLLEQMGPVKVGDISGHLHMANSNVSNICTRLEKLGLTERHRPDENRRTVEIRLTAKAVARMEEIRRGMLDMRSEMLREMTEQDIDDISRGLEKLNMLMDWYMKNHTDLHSRQQKKGREVNL